VNILGLQLKEYQVNYTYRMSDLLSYHDFDETEVILELLLGFGVF